MVNAPRSPLLVPAIEVYSKARFHAQKGGRILSYVFRAGEFAASVLYEATTRFLEHRGNYLPAGDRLKIHSITVTDPEGIELNLTNPESRWGDLRANESAKEFAYREPNLVRRIYNRARNPRGKLIDITRAYVTGLEDSLVDTFAGLFENVIAKGADVLEHACNQAVDLLRKKSRENYRALLGAFMSYARRKNIPLSETLVDVVSFSNKLEQQAEAPRDVGKERNTKSAVGAVAMYLASIIGGAVAAKEITDLFDLNFGGWGAAAEPDSGWPAEKSASQLADESGIDLVHDLERIVSVPAPDDMGQGAVSEKYVAVPSAGKLSVYGLDGKIKIVRDIAPTIKSGSGNDIFRASSVGNDRFVYCTDAGAVLESFATGAKANLLDGCADFAFGLSGGASVVWSGGNSYVFDGDGGLLAALDGHPEIMQRGDKIVVAQPGLQSSVKIFSLSNRQAHDVELPKQVYMGTAHYTDKPGNLVFAVSDSKNASAFGLLTYDGVTISDTGVTITAAVQGHIMRDLVLGDGVAAWVEWPNTQSAPPAEEVRQKAVDFANGRPIVDLGPANIAANAYFSGHRLLASLHSNPPFVGNMLVSNVVQYDLDAGAAKAVEQKAYPIKLEDDVHLLLKPGDDDLLTSGDKAIWMRDMGWWASGADRLAWVSGGQLHFASLDDIVQLMHGLIPPRQLEDFKPGDYIVHVSDIHSGMFLSGEKGYYTGALARWRAIADHLVNLTKKPKIVVVSGDVSDAGQSGSYGVRTYEDYNQVKQNLLDAGIQVLEVPGNHDGRDIVFNPVHASLGNYHEQINPQHDVAAKFKNARVVGLYSGHDVLVPGKIMSPKGSGLDDAQISWLEQQLAGADGQAIAIFMHHPVVSDVAAGQPADGLVISKNQQRLLELAKEHRAILLTGHSHYSSDLNVDGVPAIQTASTAVQEVYRPITFDGQRFVAGQPVAVHPAISFEHGSRVKASLVRGDGIVGWTPDGKEVKWDLPGAYFQSFPHTDDPNDLHEVGSAYGLEGKVVLAGIANGDLDLRIVNNLKPNRIVLDDVPLKAGERLEVTPNWPDVYNNSPHAVQLTYKTADGKQVAFRVPAQLNASEFARLLEEAQKQQKPGNSKTGKPSFDWRVPAIAGGVGGGAALGYALWRKQGKRGEGFVLEEI